MTRPILADAFEHHTWATLRLLDTLDALDDTQLETTVPGTYGSIRSTMRHLVGADVFYLSVLAPGHAAPIDEDAIDLAGMRGVMVANAAIWDEVLAGEMDPDRDLVEVGDGRRFHAPLGIRLGQVVHHGTDHRSQICTALTGLGIDPPLIDLWDFAEAQGRTRVSDD